MRGSHLAPADYLATYAALGWHEVSHPCHPAWLALLAEISAANAVRVAAACTRPAGDL